MGGLQVEVDPAEVGLDPQRLERLDRLFARYVDEQKLAGWLVTIARHGKLAHVRAYGQRDVEAGLPVEPDTLWRIYSMTKPITSVAAMMLFEEGGFELTDPVAKYIPSFADMRVFAAGSDIRYKTVPANEPIRMWHLLSHTSGLTYAFMRSHPVDALYRARGFEWGWPKGADLAACCDIWADIPLLFQPGTEWSYSVATDVLGRVVEVVSGLRLDEFFATRIFGPLGMTDSAFYASPDNGSRVAALYNRDADGKLARLDDLGKGAFKEPAVLSGGGGLVSSAADYNRFTQMLLHRPHSPAGELEGARLLSPRTVRLMTTNHLPGGGDLEEVGRPLFTETVFAGVGFGLGFAVVMDPAANKGLGSAGEFNWGGAASTAFWVDPAEQLTVGFYTQFMPSGADPIRSQLRQMVYQALID
ncbi:MAG TPA: serine hydrolase domain-containing protein [Streptosporangiaceae bacterium]|nr:serine hydrolase domain-containing protein [Streptosporangiaceae bacterium]